MTFLLLFMTAVITWILCMVITYKIMQHVMIKQWRHFYEEIGFLSKKKPRNRGDD